MSQILYGEKSRYKLATTLKTKPNQNPTPLTEKSFCFRRTRHESLTKSCLRLHARNSIVDVGLLFVSSLILQVSNSNKTMLIFFLNLSIVCVLCSYCYYLHLDTETFFLLLWANTVISLTIKQHIFWFRENILSYWTVVLHLTVSQ